MTKKQSTKNTATGKAEGSKTEKATILTPERLAQIEAEAEGFKLQTYEYATKAFTAAVAHFEKYHNNPLARSRLVVVYDEQNRRDFHLVVTLPDVLSEGTTSEVDAYGVVKDAEVIARTLEHPECSDAFKAAFEVIFTEHMGESEVSWTSPQVVRLALPLILLEQWSRASGSGMTPTDILVTLSSELVPDEVANEVRRSISKT